MNNMEHLEKLIFVALAFLGSNFYGISPKKVSFDELVSVLLVYGTNYPSIRTDIGYLLKQLENKDLIITENQPVPKGMKELVYYQFTSTGAVRAKEILKHLILKI